ncbi:MAG: ribonuclease III [Acidimicrobiales bacterium]|nr:ribonuclease III [Acidimicrobiales bacterium]
MRTSRISRPSATPSTTCTHAWVEPLSTIAPLDQLADRLGHQFSDTGLLTHALTHRSWCAENAGHDSNERLEFLGDAVLGLVVTDHIYRTYPELAEGELAKVRASVVSAPTLAELAGEVGLGDGLRLGKGEEVSGGREKPSILADAMEAVIGAVYLDGGWEAAVGVVRDLFEPAVHAASEQPGTEDFKTRLQELAARHFDGLPRYELTEAGPDHDKRFTAVVSLDGTPLGEGVGRSKKEAEQAAATAAFERLRDERPDLVGDDERGNSS